MSVRLMSQIWQTDLPETEKIVMLALADCANDEGECWPSIPHLAKKCSISERSVYRTISGLESHGYIVKESIQGKKTHYHIYPQPLTECHPCHSDTPDKMSPLSECHKTPDTVSRVPLTECHPTPDTVSVPYIEEPSVNHQVNHQEPSGVCGEGKKVPVSPENPKPPNRRRRSSAEIVAIRAWLPQDRWDAFVEHRRKIKKPLTDEAKRLSLEKLEKLRDAGNDPIEVINQSIINGWQGLFEVKDEPSSGQRYRPREKYKPPDYANMDYGDETFVSM